jgi:hypothetical protein
MLAVSGQCQLAQLKHNFKCGAQAVAQLTEDAAQEIHSEAQAHMLQQLLM